MVFSMKGGVSSSTYVTILKNNFFENHLESFPDCENVFCTLYYVCHELFFFNPSYSYLDHLTVIKFNKRGGGPPIHHPRVDFDYFSPFFGCDVRTTRADFDLFPPLFCCRGQGTKVRLFYVKRAKIALSAWA